MDYKLHERNTTWTEVTCCFARASKEESRVAFTLIELLVIIAIIGVLAALIVPAVQSAREAARRAKCNNNLRQIGIGLQAYNTTYKKYPVGGAGSASLTNVAIRRQWRPSWGSVILPYIEQSPLYDSLDLDTTYLDPVNQVGGAKIVPTYICPSSPRGSMLRPNGDTPNSTILFGRTDYAGNYGERSLRCDPPANCQNNYGTSSSAGRGMMLFGFNPQLRLSDVIDGAANTIFVGEAPQSLHSIWIGHKNLFDQSAPLNEHTKASSQWASCALGFNSPEGNFCDFGQEFHSYHSGGANFVMVDGSTHFVAETVDLKSFAAMLSRRGGDVISNSGF